MTDPLSRLSSLNDEMIRHHKRLSWVLGGTLAAAAVAKVLKRPYTAALLGVGGATCMAYEWRKIGRVPLELKEVAKSLGDKRRSVKVEEPLEKWFSADHLEGFTPLLEIPEEVQGNWAQDGTTWQQVSTAIFTHYVKEAGTPIEDRTKMGVLAQFILATNRFEKAFTALKENPTEVSAYSNMMLEKQLCGYLSYYLKNRSKSMPEIRSCSNLSAIYAAQTGEMLWEAMGLTS